MAAKDTPTEKASPTPASRDNLDLLQDTPLVMTMELGRTRKVLEDISELGEQSLIELDKAVGEPINVLVNGRLFARGEVVTVAENFGVRIIESVDQV